MPDALLEERRADREAEHRQRDEAADHGAEPERRDLEEDVARVALLGLGLALRRGGTGRRRARRPLLGLDLRRASRRGASSPGRAPSAQRKPKKTVMKTPTATIAHETTKPTSSTTTPTASPTGQRLGPGTCGVFAARVQVASNKYHRWLPRVSGQPGSQLCPNRTLPAAGTAHFCSPRPYSAQRRLDEVADLGAHLDLGRPLARPLLRQLRGGVDPELAADELPRGGVVEVVGRPLGRARRRAPGRRSRRRRRRPARSRAGRRARRRRSPSSSARAARAPRSRASPCAPAPG